MFADAALDPKLFYGAGYDNTTTVQAHSEGRHEYLIAGSALKCDLFINVPKLKTHHLLGITVAMKNLVGINGDKNYLPHFRLGFADRGGDQYPRRTPGLLLRYWILRYAMPMLTSHPTLMKAWGRLLALFHRAGGKNPYAGGGWIGNDTVWRMTLDLNRILLHAREDGTLAGRDTPRRYLTVVDGIVAGEGEGPMDVQARPAGVLLAAGNPLLCDVAAARLMGFDPERLKLVTEGRRPHELPLAPVTTLDEADLACCTVAADDRWEPTAPDDLPNLDFIPPVGWKDVVAGRRNTKEVQRRGCENCALLESDRIDTS